MSSISLLPSFGSRRTGFLAFAAAFLALALGGVGTTYAQTVTITESETDYVLANGTITARVLKRNGDLASLKHRGVEMLTDRSGHAGGYWSHDATGGKQLISRITIDPKSNSGARAEVSVKGISGGKLMGHGPGVPAGAEGDLPVDIEIRWSLGKDDSGVYTYCTFDHPAEYPAGAFTEARFAAKLAATFDWMTVDAKRDKFYPATLREGDKYVYTAVQSENPAYGWSSTTTKTGVWLINSSVEYLSGGPTKVEFLCHRDTTPVAAPIVLNYWRSSHYGGADLAVAAGEKWTKTVGPFLLYVNTDGDPKALANDARNQWKKEAAKWPYDWVAGVDYPSRNERSTVKGRLVLSDPQAPAAKTPNLRVGLTPVAYTAPYTKPAANGTTPPARQVNWQTDAKHYQFWARGDESGAFSIPQVRPGKYTLRAMTDGVLGEFAQADVVVESGKTVDLGTLKWTPVRRGKQLWEVGVPNRNGSEFAGAENFWEPSLPLEYAKRFPGDVNFTVGKSDFRKDWFFQHVPHNENPAAKVEPFYGIRSAGRPTPYKIHFDLPAAARVDAILRLAICGGGAREISVSVNDQPAGKVDQLLVDGAITRHSIQALWYERELRIPAALLNAGANVVTLTVPGGPINNGVIYDYLRLELAEDARTSGL
ncbi:MAG: polysaccharide lyase family protein [Opitutaceae bacterium]